MHETTQAMLQAIAEANDNNDYPPAQCWAHAGPAILEWRRAGKPDLDRTLGDNPLPEMPPGWNWEGHPYDPDLSPDGCWAYKGEDPYSSPWADIAGRYGLECGEPLGEVRADEPLRTVQRGMAEVERLLVEMTTGVKIPDPARSGS